MLVFKINIITPNATRKAIQNFLKKAQRGHIRALNFELVVDIENFFDVGTALE